MLDTWQYLGLIRCKIIPKLCLVLISLVATNVLFLDEDVCLFPAEGSPVLAELPHGDKVGSAGGEAAGGAEQGVAVMLPPVQTLMLVIQFPSTYFTD